MTNVGKPVQYTGNITESRRILGEICKLLLILHENNIVHCDLKLQNILIDDGKVPIIDFGHSHILNPITHMLGRSKIVEQTPTGTAPESLFGSVLPRTEKIDIWSLGCLYYELITNEKLFANEEDVLKTTLDNMHTNKINHIDCDVFDRELLQMMLVTDPTKRSNIEQISDKLNITQQIIPCLWVKPNDDIINELPINMIPLWFKMDGVTHTIGYYIIKCIESSMIEKIRPIRYSFHELVYMLVLRLFEPRCMYDPDDFYGCRLVDFDDDPNVIFDLYVSMLDKILGCFPNNPQFEVCFKKLKF